MKINIKAILRKDKVYQNQTSPVFIGLTQNRKVKFISTGVSVNPLYWDFNRYILTSDCPDRASLQKQIDGKIEGVNKQISKLEILDLEVTLEALTGSKVKQLNPTQEECFRKQIEVLKQSGKINTSIKYTFTLSSLMKFQPRIKLREVNISFLRDFETFLEKQGNTGNTIATKMSTLKAVYNKSIRDSGYLMDKNQFLDYRIGALLTPTRKRAVDKSTVKLIQDMDLPKARSPYMELSRDIFLFSYYTAGMNFKDIALLRYADTENGRICYSRRKTKKVINCVLIEPAQSIISKYKQLNSLPDDYIFPILDKQVHKRSNRYITGCIRFSRRLIVT